MDEDLFEISEQDYIVRVRPSVVDDQWTGEIDIAIITSAGNTLDDESYGQLMHFTKMMCASVPLMEADEAMRNYVHNYVLEELDNNITDIVEEEDSEVTITKEDGNVVRLSFGTRTKGSA